MSGPGKCPRCGRRAAELHHSIAAGGVVCLDCHCQAAPEASAETLAYRPPRTRRDPPPQPPWVQFRSQILDALLRVDSDRYMSLGDGERVIGMCPVCRAGLPEHLLVRFHGRAPRADLVCSLGCPERDIAAKLARRA